MLKNRKLLGILLSIIMVMAFSVSGYAFDYKYTQESGTGFFVGTADKADALEDSNELRQIVNDLGTLLQHSKMDGSYPADSTTGGTLGVLNTSNIIVEELGTATYDDIQDWINNTQSAGKMSGGTISVHWDNITGVTIGGAGSGEFKVADDQTAGYPAGTTINVIESTNNNGDYTVSAGGSSYSAGTTTIPVDEAVAAVADGKIRNGRIDIAAGTGFIKTTDSEIGITKSFDWNTSYNLLLTDLETNYIHINYNAGSPIFQATTDRDTIELNREFTFGMVYRNGARTWVHSDGMNLPNYLRNSHERLLAVWGYRRAEGGEISEYGTRNIQSTAGIFYRGIDKVTTAIQASATDKMTTVYYDGSNWVWTALETQIDNTQYNNIASGLATLSNNKYGVHWVCIDYFGELMVIYGQGNYTLTEAQNAKVPSLMPVIANDFGIIASKIIIEKSAASFTEIISAYTECIPSASPATHNELSGLQGGTASEYYHLTSANSSDVIDLFSNIVLCSKYDHPDDAITAISSTNKTLLVTEAETCDTNFTVPANVTVKFERGGKWTINTGVTVTFNGQIDAGLWQIFAYTGTGTLAGTPQVKEVYPQWWGATGDGTTDDITAITNTIASLTSGGVIYFPTGTYRITSAITVNKRCKIFGSVRTEDETTSPPVIILKDGDFTGVIITSFSVIIEGIVVKGDTGNGGDGIQIKANGCTLQNVSSINHAAVGIRIGDDSEAVNCNSWRLIDVVARNNDSHGVLIDDTGAEPDANAGLATGLFCHGNGGDGLKIDRAQVNNFYGVLTQSNTGVGIRVGASARNNTFWNPHSEGNTSDQFVFDATSTNNLVIGSMNYDPTDNGKNTVIKNQGGTSQILSVSREIDAPSFTDIIVGDSVEILPYRDNWITNVINSAIYRTSDGGGAYPFLTAGNLVIQPRSSAARDIIFATGSTTPAARMKIKGDGDVEIVSGKLIMTGGQVSLPATQAPSADVNTLDDYEEGTWTPAIKFGGNSVDMTYTTQAGEYTKIGRQVTLTGYILLSAKGSSAGNVTITGLPFASKNSDGAYSAVTLRLDNITFANVYQGQLNKNTSIINLNEVTEAGVLTAITEGDFVDDSKIHFSITYFTD